MGGGGGGGGNKNTSSEPHWLALGPDCQPSPDGKNVTQQVLISLVEKGRGSHVQSSGKEVMDDIERECIEPGMWKSRNVGVCPKRRRRVTGT